MTQIKNCLTRPTTWYCGRVPVCTSSYHGLTVVSLLSPSRGNHRAAVVATGRNRLSVCLEGELLQQIQTRLKEENMRYFPCTPHKPHNQTQRDIRPSRNLNQFTYCYSCRSMQQQRGPASPNPSRPLPSLSACVIHI